MMKKKTVFADVVLNRLVVLPNGMVSVPIIGITFSIHRADRTWSVHLFLLFWRVDFGWVDRK